MHSFRLAACAFAALSLVTASAAVASPSSPAKIDMLRTTLFAVTASDELVSFSPSEPGVELSRVSLKGLSEGERILGIDYRVAYGVMYALVSSGRIATVDAITGELNPTGSGRFAIALEGKRFGFDFNPAADRIRIVSDAGQNLRAHPETGDLVDGDAGTEGLQPDGRLHYADGDVNAGTAPAIAAAGYTYNSDNEKLTTNYAIDVATGMLVRQGSIEGAEPAVSPNTGKLFSVGKLGVEGISDAHLDISDVSNTAFAVFTTASDSRAVLYVIDLESGAATKIGVIGDGTALSGFAIEP